ncbi:MAG TPA: cytochrome c [Pyrinomonadaceae bacterium]|nr:cytochrome c [Pyrinomonadaceae bacterium]
MRISSFVFLLCITALAVHANRNARSAPQLYRKYCVSCHGSDGRAQTSKGKFSHARNLTDAKWQEEASDARIFNSIMNGRNERGNMPAFSNKINEKEADSLVNFVRRLRG